MNPGKVVFAFFILLAMTLNFAFFIGAPEDPGQHNVYLLFAAITVGIIATILKFGERSQLGAVLLATSLVADLQLIAAALVWAAATFGGAGLSAETMSLIVALSGGGLLANLVSVILLTAETIMSRR